MNIVEGVLLWIAVGLYGLTVTLALVGASFGRSRPKRLAWVAGACALAAHAGAVAARWIATGHAPVMYAYENSLTGSWFLGSISAVLVWRYEPARRALPLVAGVVLLLLGNGLLAPRSLVPLEPPFRSGWLWVHVSFAWLAFGSYVVASVTALVYLWRGWRGGEGEAKRLALVDDLTGRLIAFGFAADTVMIASGAIWAHGLWGRYWAWDPVETWSLVSWLLYGINLHLRFTLGWQGRRASWLALASVAGVVMSFFGLGALESVHTEML